MSDEQPEITMGRRTTARGRGFGNASPVCGLEVNADLASKRVVRCCETPEFYRENGCPHGRGEKKTRRVHR
jgi:hypothetical protein